MFSRKSVHKYIDRREIGTRVHSATVFTNIRANLTSFERSVLCKAAREWNGLETFLQKIETKNSFKLAQKKWAYETIAIPRNT